MTNRKIKAMNRIVFEAEFQIQPTDLIFIVEQSCANGCSLMSGVYVPDSEDIAKFLLARGGGIDLKDGVRVHTNGGIFMDRGYRAEYRSIVTAGKIFGVEEYAAIITNALRGEDFKHAQARGMQKYVEHEQKMAMERKIILGDLYDDEIDNLAPNLVEELKRIYGE
jgi:hypothetical protein